MRKKIVAGNWKMNRNYEEAIDLIRQISTLNYSNDVELIVFPPAVYVSDIVKELGPSEISVGVQNSSQFDSGAYTGEVSAAMIKSLNVKYALVGHSERREYFKERNSVLALKVDQLLKNNLSPIYCCGEVLEDRRNDNHFNVIKTQIEKGLFHLDKDQIRACIVAYEPVWAIGTGVTASSDQAQEMHSYIRTLLTEQYGATISETISILYGGSCKPNNAKEIFANPDVDGGLIGGASLSAEDFIAIANSH